MKLLDSLIRPLDGDKTSYSPSNDSDFIQRSFILRDIFPPRVFLAREVISDYEISLCR